MAKQTTLEGLKFQTITFALERSSFVNCSIAEISQAYLSRAARHSARAPRSPQTSAFIESAFFKRLEICSEIVKFIF